MVYFQVDGLYKMFAGLADLERNAWQVQPPSPKKQKLQVHKRTNLKIVCVCNQGIEVTAQ